jgi:adenylosuccinate lyase
MSKIFLRHTLTKKFLTFWTSLSAMVMELPDIIKHAAQELEENIVDVNGVDQIGNLVI